ncbi:MAG: branched-chain amino acid transaminase [Alphaproteobacteria bacterium]|nr:branched-chain amino acid transaminase [Alphaproteobacteria bacterium]MDX5367803.1 branched-chain amino acid transaminase [Alphaproteobacteria bacterium]MDX5462689.1 branched-chain amino acid transaminase [Alphaproteobacteria bacterium]
MDTSNAPYMILNGKVVPFAEARIHCLAPAVTYGANVFEGLRAYWNADDGQLYVFRVEEHLDRLFYSAKVMRIEHPWTREDFRNGLLELLRVNEVRESVHMRIHLYVDEDGFMTATSPGGMFISCVFRPTSKIAMQGCRAQVSSWTRISDNASPPRVKSAANYFNGRLASLQAKSDGYDTAILLSDTGRVTEGPGACLFIVRDGRIVTPDVSNDILESITRATLIEGAKEWLGLDVEQRPIARTELYAADEVFFCGTGQEVLPVVEIDRFPVGAGTVGPITAELQRRYFGVARGTDTAHPDWRTPVYV